MFLSKEIVNTKQQIKIEAVVKDEPTEILHSEDSHILF